jgi:hypothetical protein
MSTSPPHAAPAAQAHWTTSSFGACAESSPMELSVLREHLDLCSGQHRRWFRARCAADAVRRFVASRLVTTCVVVALLIAFAISGW